MKESCDHLGGFSLKPFVIKENEHLTSEENKTFVVEIDFDLATAQIRETARPTLFFRAPMQKKVAAMHKQIFRHIS